MKKPAILIGGVYDTTNMGISVELMIDIDKGVPNVLSYPFGVVKMEYIFDKALNSPDNDVLTYVLKDMPREEVFNRLTANYGKAQKLLANLQHQLNHVRLPSYRMTQKDIMDFVESEQRRQEEGNGQAA